MNFRNDLRFRSVHRNPVRSLAEVLCCGSEVDGRNSGPEGCGEQAEWRSLNFFTHECSVSAPIRPAQSVHGFRRAVYLLAGGLALVLAGIGTVVPGLPTTPFLIVAVAFFSRSSPRMHDALVRSRLFGPYIQDWRTHRAIRPHVRYLALVAVVTGVGVTCVWSPVGWPIKSLTILAGGIGLAVVFRLPVRSSEGTGAVAGCGCGTRCSGSEQSGGSDAIE